MSTDFNYSDKVIMSKGPLRPNRTNTPLDSRTRINTIADMASIPNPYIGMLVYVIDEDKYYKVKTLKASNLGVANSLVDTYEVLSTANGETSTPSADTNAFNAVEFATDELIFKNGTTEKARANIGNKLIILTQQEYDALEIKEQDVAYLISDSEQDLSNLVTKEEFNQKVGNKVLIMTQAQYDALPTKESDVLYVISDNSGTSINSNSPENLTISNGTLQLTKSAIQTVTMATDTTILTPTVTKFTQIHLYFSIPAGSSTMTINLPTAKWQNTVTFEAGKAYEIVLTTLTGAEWLGGIIVYA